MSNSKPTSLQEMTLRLMGFLGGLETVAFGSEGQWLECRVSLRPTSGLNLLKSPKSAQSNNLSALGAPKTLECSRLLVACGGVGV